MLFPQPPLNLGNMDLHREKENILICHFIIILLLTTYSEQLNSLGTQKPVVPSQQPTMQEQNQSAHRLVDKKK